MLRDGNSTLYPLAKDCADSIRDPQPLDLPPVRCVGMGTLALTGTSHNMKNQASVIVFALEQQLLMSKILKCDVEGARQILGQLELDCSKYFKRMSPDWYVKSASSDFKKSKWLINF